jgi:IMP dehydrogenase
MKIAQGVSGTVRSKGSVHNTLPFLCQAVRQGFQVHASLTAFRAAVYSVRLNCPGLQMTWLRQYVRQGIVLWLQDIGARSLEAAHRMLDEGNIYFETRTGAAQAEGNIHDMHSFEKVRW